MPKRSSYRVLACFESNAERRLVRLIFGDALARVGGEVNQFTVENKSGTSASLAAKRKARKR